MRKWWSINEHKWLYNGIIHNLESSKYPDRYYVIGHEIPSISERSVTLVGPRVYKIGALISVNKYEFLEEHLLG